MNAENEGTAEAFISAHEAEFGSFLEYAEKETGGDTLSRTESAASCLRSLMTEAGLLISADRENTVFLVRAWKRNSRGIICAGTARQASAGEVLAVAGCTAEYREQTAGKKVPLYGDYVWNRFLNETVKTAEKEACSVFEAAVLVYSEPDYSCLRTVIDSKILLEGSPVPFFGRHIKNGKIETSVPAVNRLAEEYRNMMKAGGKRQPEEFYNIGFAVSERMDSGKNRESDGITGR